jgi:hypothetical protein
MDPQESKTRLHEYNPSDVLTQMSYSISAHHGDLKMKLPTTVTYKSAIEATSDCLGDINDKFALPLRVKPEFEERLREMALRNISDMSTFPQTSTLPIRKAGLLKDAGFPKPLSKTDMAKLKENAQNMPPFPDPYALTLRASITEGKLPTVTANVSLRALDWCEGQPVCALSAVEMLWDTGAHNTFVTKEMLPPSFKYDVENNHIHDAYRTKDGLRVQLQFIIEFSNSIVQIDSVAMVVTKLDVPNERVGVIFGQNGCIDRIVYRSIPRAALKAKGEDIAEDVWGDIIVEGYVDIDGKIQAV